MNDNTSATPVPRHKKRRWLRRLAYVGAAALILLVIGRLMLPTAVRLYVNRVIDQSPLYSGEIGDVEIHLYRGAYSIDDIRLNKTTGNVPVPLFVARKLDLRVDWEALLSGKIRARVVIEGPELNFVDAPDDSSSQSGDGGPWLAILNDLSPFRINSAIITGGSVHFRAYQTTPPVDVFLSKLEARISNLGNIRDETAPLIAKIDATATVMDSGELELHVGFNPFSYNPSFNLACKLLSLDVTKINDLARAYGAFDFEHGFFDLVIEAKAREGQLDGYVKPLFRDLKILSLRQDIQEDNVLEFFWEALVGGTAEVLKNPGRNQFGTVIPFSGTTTAPHTDLLSTVGNVLRNAFIRAYLPKLVGRAPDVNNLQFSLGQQVDPVNAVPQTDPPAESQSAGSSVSPSSPQTSPQTDPQTSNPK